MNILQYFMTSHNCYMLCNTQNSTPHPKNLEYYCQLNTNALKILNYCKMKIYPIEGAVAALISLKRVGKSDFIR